MIKMKRRGEKVLVLIKTANVKRIEKREKEKIVCDGFCIKIVGPIKITLQ